MTYVLLACDIAVLLVIANRLLARVTWSDVAFALLFVCLGIFIFLPVKEVGFLCVGFAVAGVILRKLRSPVERKVLRKVRRIRRMKDPSQYARTILELDRMDPLDSSANRYLHQFLEDDNENVRWFVVEVLTRTGDQETVERFLHLLRQNPADPEIYIRGLGDLEDPRAIPVLIPYLNNSQSHVRQWTVHSLVKLQADAAVEDLLKRIVVETDRDVLCGLLRAVVHFGALSSLVSRWKYLEAETQARILTHAGFLKETEYHKVAPLVANALQSECRATVYQALEVMFRMQLTSQRDGVDLLKDNADPLIRAVARKLLNDVWDEDHEIEPLHGTGQERRTGAPPDPDAFIRNIPGNAEAFRQSVRDTFDVIISPDVSGIERLDRLIDERWSAGKSPATGILTVYIGAFVGEAIRRRQGGQWQFQGGQYVLAGIGSGPAVSPFIAARKRLVGGPAESLAAYLQQVAEIS